MFGNCNVGGFGIDGGVSCMIGAFLAHPDKLFFCVFGDLAFFYDMNVLGNRHVGKNIRLMLVNNSRGSEFRLYCHPCAQFGEDADFYMAAADHYGQQSPDLVRHYSTDLGFEYLAASTKDEFEKVSERFFTPKVQEKPMILEVFTETQNESDALMMIQEALTEEKMRMIENCKKVARKVVPSSLLKATYKLIHNK